MMSAQTSGDANRDQRRQDALLGYVNFAERNPALYELMFSRDRLVNDDPALLEEIRTCFVILADASEDLSWHQGTVDQKTGKGQVALWSFVYGYAQLITAQRLKKDNMQDLVHSGYFTSYSAGERRVNCLAAALYGKGLNCRYPPFAKIYWHSSRGLRQLE